MKQWPARCPNTTQPNSLLNGRPFLLHLVARSLEDHNLLSTAHVELVVQLTHTADWARAQVQEVGWFGIGTLEGGEGEEE